MSISIFLTPSYSLCHIYLLSFLLRLSLFLYLCLCMSTSHSLTLYSLCLYQNLSLLSCLFSISIFPPSLPLSISISLSLFLCPYPSQSSYFSILLLSVLFLSPSQYTEKYTSVGTSLSLTNSFYLCIPLSQSFSLLFLLPLCSVCLFL